MSPLEVDSRHVRIDRDKPEIEHENSVCLVVGLELLVYTSSLLKLTTVIKIGIMFTANNNTTMPGGSFRSTAAEKAGRKAGKKVAGKHIAQKKTGKNHTRFKSLHALEPLHTRRS